jgi:hypothetical protein
MPFWVDDIYISVAMSSKAKTAYLTGIGCFRFFIHGIVSNQQAILLISAQAERRYLLITNMNIVKYQQR